MGEWEWEDLGGRTSDDATNNGPDSGIRNVRFSAGEGGRELMIFAEHTTNLHVIDARTFDLASHTIIPFPDLLHLPPSPESSSDPTLPARSPSSPPNIIRAPESPIQQSYRPPILIAGRRSRSRSRTPPHVSQIAPPPHVVEDASPRGQQPTVVVVPHSPRRSRSRSRSPTVIVVPPPIPLPLPPPPVQPDERELYWPPPTGESEPPESRERQRLDADGDVIERRGSAEGFELHSPVPVDDADPSIHWPRPVGRVVRMGMTRAPEATPLESVAEGGEPVPQRPTHIAGVCFDPSGGWVYVASENRVVEWRVREREEGKTCWGSGAWA